MRSKREEAEKQAFDQMQKDQHEPRPFWTGPPFGQVEIASVSLWRKRTHRLMAQGNGSRVAYQWVVSGAGTRVPADPKSTKEPMGADELMTLLEKTCCSGSFFSKSWDEDWETERRKEDFDDSTQDFFEEHLNRVTSAYTVHSKFYLMLPGHLEQAVQEWQDEKMEEWQEKRHKKAESEGDTDAQFDDACLMEYDFSTDDPLYEHG